jgi:uncharacterized membrane protein
MYKIIGADQKEYGPVTAEQLRQWLSEGRVNGQTSVQAEGATEWKPLATFAEFADVLTSAPQPYGPQPGPQQDVFGGDYDLDIGQCVANAWHLLQNNFGMIFGGVAIFMAIEMGIGLLGQIPIVGIVVSLASLIVTGPLTGGVYFFLLKCIRGQPAEIGDVFAGFRLAFGQLLLGYLVMVLLITLSGLPGFAIMAVPVITMIHHRAAEAGLLLIAALGFIVAMIPAIYFSVSWLFSLPLIIDKQMEFWSAMSTSRRMVGKHWWLIFGLVVVCGLIKLAGFAVCCVGLFFTLPITFGAMMYAYESIFSAPAPRPA